MRSDFGENFEAVVRFDDPRKGPEGDFVGQYYFDWAKLTWHLAGRVEPDGKPLVNVNGF